jgi:hypothetical protein
MIPFKVQNVGPRTKTIAPPTQKITYFCTSGDRGYIHHDKYADHDYLDHGNYIITTSTST